MVRAQIVLDEPTAEQLRAVSVRSKSSMSEVVRRALVFWFENREPDTTWVGSLKPKRKFSHRLSDIHKSIAAGRKREPRK